MRNEGARRVVVVEDNELTAKLYHDLIKAHWPDVEIDCFHSAELALSCLNMGEQCNVVITDVQLPGMSGIELAYALRSSGSSMAIVVITSFATTEKIADITRSGADYCLTKPVRVAKFLEMIRDQFGSSVIDP